MIGFCACRGARLPAPPPVECPACQTTTWVNAKPSASAVLLDADRFLTVRRAREPAAGCWDLPGGFCDGAEHPSDAAIRETFEETGLRVRLGPLIGLCLDDYTYQGDTTPTLNAYYVATLADPRQVPAPSAEATAVRWWPLRDPPRPAFAHQQRVIADAAVAAVAWTR